MSRERTPRRGSRTLLRALLGIVVVLVVGAVAVVIAASLLIDPAAYKPRIEAAVQRATGHPLLLRGPLRLQLGLPPRLVAEDVALAASPPGGPDLIRLRRLEARVALLPLLHGVVRVARLDLVHPDIDLTTGATTAPATPTPTPPATGAASPTPPTTTAAPRLDIGAVHIQDGRLIWHDAGSGRTLTLEVPLLDADASGPSVVLTGTLTSAGSTLLLTGEMGSWTRLMDRAAATPWPVQLVLQGEAVRLAVRGTFTRPLQAAGYDLQVDAAATDLAAFVPLLPAPLPTFHDVSVSARLADTGQAMPRIEGLTAHVGGLALPHLMITRANIAAPGAPAPAQVEMEGTFGGSPLHLGGTVTGDLRPGGTLALHGLTLSGPPVQLTAELTATLAPHPVLRGTLSAQRLDLDALLAALPPRTQPAAVAGTPPAPAAPARLIPDQPIDLSPLHAVDADLQLSVAALLTGGVTYTGVAGHLLLQDGHLTLDPFAGDLPGGRLVASMSVDARQGTPPMALRLHAPALALAPLAAAFGHAGAITGTAFVDADLKAAGASPHALAATASGHLGVAVADASADNAVLAGLFGGVLRAAKLPADALGADAGQTKLHCLAVRLEAHDGTAEVATLVADTGRLQLQGTGSIALGPEELDLHLRPMLRVGPGIIVPVHLGGTLLEPKPTLDKASSGRAALLGQMLGEKPADACPAGLAAARGEAPPPAPATAAPEPATGKPAKPPKPIDILRNLLSR